MKILNIKTLIITPVILILAACGSLLAPSDVGSNTESYDNDGIVKTMTARAVQGGSNSELSTAVAKSTALSQELTAMAIQNQTNWQATATAGAPVFLELPIYGVDPQRGFVAWIDNPVIIQLSKYQDFLSANNFPEVIGKDFVLAADITWNLNSGTSGCGFVFRSDGDKEEPNQYIVLLKPDSGGSLIFTAVKDGTLVNMMTYYPSVIDESFSWVNNSTNRLVLVAQQDILTFFSNGKKISEIDIRNQPSDPIPEIPIIPIIPTTPSYNRFFPFLPEGQGQDYSQLFENFIVPSDPMQGYPQMTQQNYTQFKSVKFYDGFLSLIAYNQSGFTECTFENTWLFTIGTQSNATPGFDWTATYTPTPTRISGP